MGSVSVLYHLGGDFIMGFSGLADGLGNGIREKENNIQTMCVSY